MTVCIAAITRGEDYQGGLRGIVCASDRMLTLNDTEYEAFQTKVFQPKPGIAVLLSGVIEIHSTIISRVSRDLSRFPSTTPETISELYANHIRKLRSELAEQEYLSPFDLTHESFLDRQQTMAPAEVSRLTQKISNYAFAIEAIVAGIDDTGQPQLYEINGAGISTCKTDIGVAAIGIGADHATLQLILSRYSRAHATDTVALALLYAAKKSAELWSRLIISTI